MTAAEWRTSCLVPEDVALLPPDVVTEIRVAEQVARLRGRGLRRHVSTIRPANPYPVYEMETVLPSGAVAWRPVPKYLRGTSESDALMDLLIDCRCHVQVYGQPAREGGRAYDCTVSFEDSTLGVPKGRGTTRPRSVVEAFLLAAPHLSPPVAVPA